MNPSSKILAAFAAALAICGCSTTQSDRDSNASGGGMHRAEAMPSTSGDSSVNCAPDKIGSAAGQGSDCRHGTGGATSTPPDSSSSNDPNAPTSPPR
jgi:hypothetical protein